MSVKASSQITVADMTDVDYIRYYYLLQSSTLSAPAVPTSNPPGGGWSLTEPSYTTGSTNSLYTVVLTSYTNGDYDYSDVSLSSSYEAAKAAYNLASNTASSLQETINTVSIESGRLDDHDLLIQSIQSDYTAQSDFGVVKNSLENYISMNDSAVTQANTYTQSVETGLNDFKSVTNGFIRSGFIGVDSDNVPIEGIMIAQQLTTREVTATVGGVQKTVTVIVGPEFYSTFTAKKLSFWQNGTEIAYVSGSRLYITDAVFLGYINMKDKWSITATNGFTIKWIGA